MELILLTFEWDETASGTARSKTYVLLLTVPEAVSSHTKGRSRSAVKTIPHSSLRKESPAELLLLTFEWDETASGTARSKTENGLYS